MKKIILFIILFFGFPGFVFAQRGGWGQYEWNFSKKIVQLPNGTDLPTAQCDSDSEKGRIFIKTDATSGQQVYVCEGTLGWKLQGDGGGTGSSGYATIQDEGTSLTQRSILNFIGSSVTCSDDSGNTRTNCTFTDNDTTYSASGTLLGLSGTVFSVNEGTLTNGKGCKYVAGTGLVCDQDYLTSEVDGDTTNELQDIFQNVTDGTSTATADSTTDTLTMSAGSGISVSVDSSTDTVTITNTGDTNSSDDLTTSTSFSGDVTGTYNNLQLGSGVVGTTEIADGSVDISTDTNLSGGRSITLNGDAVDADSELYTDTKCIYIEDPTADDDLTSIWWTYKPVTITKIWCESDQTVNMDLQIDDGTPADVNGSDIACTSTPTTDSSLAGDTTMGQGDRLDLAITSVSGTPTWVSICWEYTRDD